MSFLRVGRSVRVPGPNLLSANSSREHCPVTTAHPSGDKSGELQASLDRISQRLGVPSMPVGLRSNDALNRGRSYATARGLADDTGKFERSRERLYVGLSRARDQLVVCGDPEFIREVGGPDLARRLSLPPEHPDPETMSR